MLSTSECFPAVISSIGDPTFGNSLLSLLRDSYGADHCAVFLLAGSAPRELASSSYDGTDTAHQRVCAYVQTDLWRRDPTMSEVWGTLSNPNPRVMQLNVRSLEDNDLRTHIYPHVADRLLVCGQSAVGTIALSIIKADLGNQLSLDAVADIKRWAPTLLSILGKHASLVMRQSTLLRALTSLSNIEQVVGASRERFPRREAQVCARILYGIYTAGIAQEFAISEETVTTYRKRIYTRLGIGSQRELLLWYVKRWSESPLRFDLDSQVTRHH
jgi:DNA-binding CsgD family transcriptional regulator